MISFFKKNYHHFLLLLIIFFPNNNSFYGGLPLNSPFEYVIILVIIPTFYLLKFFKNIGAKLKFLLIVIFFLKLTLIFSPQNGVLIKQYFDAQEVKQNRYIKTFDTFWNKSFSTIQTNDWKTKRHFPIDWVLGSDVNKITKYGNSIEDEFSYETGKYINSFEDFNSLPLIYKIQFWLFIKKDTTFKIIAEGTNEKQSNLSIKEKGGGIQKLFLNKSINLKKGIYEISGNIKFSDGNDWILYPSIKNKNQYFVSAFKEKIIFAENIGSKKNFLLNCFKISGFIFDALLVIFLFLVFFKRMKGNNIFLLLSISSTISYFFIYQCFSYFNLFKMDGYGSATLAINIIIMLCLLLLLLYKKKITFDDSSLIPKVHLLIYSIPILIFFFTKNFSEIYSVKEWSWGDDWDVFQQFSREIVIDGDWLLAGEEIFYFRPLSRYVNAIHKIFFGWSHFASIITEVWSVILISYFTHLICNNLKINNYISLILSSLLLSLYLGENYRWLIGRGMAEFYAASLIMLTVYLLGKNQMTTQNLIICIMLGILGSWLREDHGLLLVSLIFFIPTKFQFMSKDSLPGVLILFFRRYFFTMFKFGFFITVGFSLMFLRNYYLSGNFAFLDHPNLKGNWDRDEISVWINLFLGVQTNSDALSENIFYRLPRTYSIFLISGFVLSIFSVWKIKYIKNNFALPVAIFSILIPYIHLNVLGYAPRYTIHYLPFCLLIIGSYLTYLIDTKYKLSKFK